jgi:uncharacterized protein YpmB
MNITEARRWIEYNLRIIIALIIVSIITTGIYFYSEKNPPQVKKEKNISEICDNFGYRTKENMPVKCLEYYNLK